MHRFTMIFLLAGGLLVGPIAHVSAVIDQVTVFSDRATVTRIVELELASGSGELVQDDLPVGLMRDSLRISATGPDGLRLGAYRLERVRGADRVSERARRLESEIESLKDRRDVLDDYLNARRLQMRLLESLAVGAGSGDERLPPNGWESAVNVLGERAEAVLVAKRKLSVDRRELDRQIERLERELADLGQQQRDSMRLELAYASSHSGRARFEIEYTVGGASWRPVYEYRLDTVEVRLDIVKLAEVHQRTGEDWSDAVVSLSLARPSAGGQLPELQPWWIDVYTPPPEGRTDRRKLAAPMMETVADAALLADAEWDAAELEGTGFTQAWRVPGRVTVAADNQAHRFGLGEHSLSASLSARTVPRRQVAAWLFVEAEYDGQAPLPPGPVSLYQDQTVVGQTSSGILAPGQPVALSFGVDDRISVKFELISDERGAEGVIRRANRQTRRWQLSLANGHDRPIEIRVLDHMPVARDERIQVKLTDDSRAPDARDVDDRPGLLAWDRTLAAGDSERLIIGYRLTYPQDIEGIVGW